MESNVVSVSMAGEAVDRVRPEAEVMSYYSTKPTILHLLCDGRNTVNCEHALKDSLIWQDGIGWSIGESASHKSYKNATEPGHGVLVVVKVNHLQNS